MSGNDGKQSKFFSLYSKNENDLIEEGKVNSFLEKIGSKKRVKGDHTEKDFANLVKEVIEIRLTEHRSTKIEDIIISFFHLDYDSDGCISKVDLTRALLSIGIALPESEISVLHSKIDPNSNGCPSIHEYASAVSSE